MVELLRYLEANVLHLLHRVRRWSRFHATRSPSTIYGIPPERVVGSSQGLRFEGARRTPATC